MFSLVKKGLKKSMGGKRKMMSMTDSTTTTTTTTTTSDDNCNTRNNNKSINENNHSSSNNSNSNSNQGNNETMPTFHEFALLSDDIRRLILSFISDAPMELKPLSRRQGRDGRRERNNNNNNNNDNDDDKYRGAALTCSLPYVNKQFRDIANSEDLWEAALLRQLSKKECYHLWRGGLRGLLPTNSELAGSESDGSDGVADTTTTTTTTTKALLNAVKNHIGEDNYRSKDVYRRIITCHIQIEAPVFIMPCQLQLGEIYGLHLFEPRYRIMVREVLDNHCENPQEARSGGVIRPKICPVDGYRQYPMIIHACRGTRLGPGQLACLVQIAWCRTYEYGTADVQLLPIAWVKLNEIYVRPNSGHLFCAKGIRI